MNSQQILNLYRHSIKVRKLDNDFRKMQRSWLKIPPRQRLMVFDCETTGVVFDEPTILRCSDGREVSCPGPVIFGISLAVPTPEQLYLVWARMDTLLYDRVCRLLSKPSIKIAHNARYDIRCLDNEDIKITYPVDCTQTMSRIVYDRRKKHALQKLAEIWCPELSDWEEPVKAEMTKIKTAHTKSGHPKGYANYSFLPDRMVGKYSMIDSFMCLVGYKILWPIIKLDFLEMYERERQVYYEINKVESHGMAFDAAKARQRSRRPIREMSKSCNQMYQILGREFNPNAPLQVASVLKEIGVPARDLTLKGKTTTVVDVLNRAHRRTKKEKVKKFIPELLNYRSHIKVVNTYLSPLIERAERNDGIIYTSINPTDTRTSRMASRSPNLLNIPEPVIRRSGHGNPVRECFVCRPGHHIYYFDISNQEMALFGLYTEADLILDTYAKGGDIHGKMASYLYGKNYTDRERGLTKNNNFGIIYGMGIRGMALMYGLEESEAKENMNIYLREFPFIKDFQEKCRGELEQQGYVEDYFGKRYHIPIGESYKAVNALVQGGCAQAFKIGFLSVSEYLKKLSHPAYIILPVYDELQIESKIFNYGKIERRFTDDVSTLMVGIPQLLDRGLRLRVDVSKTATNWAEKEKIKV